MLPILVSNTMSTSDDICICCLLVTGLLQLVEQELLTMFMYVGLYISCSAHGLSPMKENVAYTGVQHDVCIRWYMCLLFISNRTGATSGTGNIYCFGCQTVIFYSV